MKRTILTIIAAILALMLTFSLAACGGSDSAPATEAAATEAAPSGDDGSAAISAAQAVFTYNGASVELDSKMEDVLASLGEALDVSSQLSCHGEGDDKTYTYDGFTVGTYPKDGVDHVLEIVISSENIATADGIAIGASVDEVVGKYGDGYKEVGKYYSYDAGSGKSLQFRIEDGKVVEIIYYYDV
jgi:hypothetical protein